MKYLTPLLLFFSSCTAPVKTQDIRLTNDTPETLVVTASYLFFVKEVEIKPGYNWTGWVPIIQTNNKVQITIRSKK